MTSSDLLPPPPLTLAGVTSGTAKKKRKEKKKEDAELQIALKTHVGILKPEECVETNQLQDSAGLPLLGIGNISK